MTQDITNQHGRLLPEGQKRKKKKGKGANRSIETMFRITSTNNQRLSDMADNKANILITVNSIILSVITSLLLQKLNESTRLVLPTYTLFITCIFTIVVAIIATKPLLPDGKFTVREADEKR